MKQIFMYFWNLSVQIIYFFKKKKLAIKKKKIKILLLKPYFYLDLYTKNSEDFKKVIFSSYYRFGPVGLFSDLKSDFYITSGASHKIFENRINDRLRSKKNKKLMYLQKKNSINVSKIDFRKYDIVLAYEGAVSRETIVKNPSIKWGIILEDHSNLNFKKFLFFKPVPYDFFVNLTQGYTPYSFLRRKHSIDFSYTFGSPDFLKKMNIKKTYNIDVIVEVQQPEEVLLNLKKMNIKVQKLDGNLKIKKYIKKLSKSKIFYCPLFTTPRWGNSIIEASMCQNLIIGNKRGYWNSQLIHEDLHCSSIEDGGKIINKIFSNKKMYNYYLSRQNKILDEINYKLPLTIYNIL